MIIVRLCGGLGNQMFQYALYKAFLERGTDAKLDISKFKHIDMSRECFLNYGCFDLKYELCTKKEARRYVIGTGMTARIVSRLLRDKKTHIYEKEDYVYDKSVLDLKEGFLEGFWQSWKYAGDIQDIIKKDYKFVNTLIGQNKNYEDMINSTESVAVHIRRGDYLENEDIYGNICTEQYYHKAIEIINNQIKNPKYYFFSNDLKWVREKFGEADNYIYVEGNPESKGYIDMRLMSACKHQIIANSSFSWWAAYLNSNADKKVISPNKWINGRETPDVYCADWIKI